MKIKSSNYVKLFFTLFLLSLCLSQNMFADTTTINKDIKDTNQVKKRVYLAKSILSYGVDTTFCSEYKIAAALNLAMLVTHKYELISQTEIKETIKKLPKQYTAFDIAKEVNANSILVVKVEQMRNLLRAEISSISPENPDSVKMANGYAMLHYFTNDEHQAIYDPTLLLALQRAFAVVENDSTLFIKQKVQPAPLLAICGIEFIKGKNPKNWEIFTDELVRSYEMTETIFEEIAKSKKWVVLDIESRDHLYSLFKLYGVENNIAPNISEIAALKQFGINHYITGKIVEEKKRLTISLTLNEIRTKEVVTIKEISEITKESKVKKILEILKRLTKKLIID